MAENDDAMDDDEQESGLFRWMSALVVMLAVAGFFGLAWYAYKNGGESVSENDVELIKAEETPAKSAPENPGGMQIPDQDKTVYGLISGKPQEKRVVEHIMPAPEQPIARGGDTQTWMSDSVKGKAAGTEEAKPSASAPAPQMHETPASPKEQFNPDKTRAAEPDKSASAPPQPAAATPSPATAAPAAATPAAETKPNPPAQAQKAPAENVKSDKDEEEAKPQAQPQEKPPAGVRVQLGSYRSQSEAEENWGKISSKFADNFAAKRHYIVKVSLGAKGIYYRLQVAPFDSTDDAEQFCFDFVSAGQGCIVTQGK